MPHESFPQQQPIHSHDGLNSSKVDFNTLRNVSGKKVTYNPVSLPTGSAETKDFAVEVARFNNAVLVTAPYDLQGLTATGYVSGKGTVTVQLINQTGNRLVLDIYRS